MSAYSRRLMLRSMGAAAGLVAAGKLRSACAQTGAIRIGVVAPLSGTQQLTGEPNLVGANVARDYFNRQGGINGRAIEIVSRDDKGDPNSTVSILRELVGAGINMFLGASITPTALAAAGVIKDLDGVCLTQAVDDRLVREAFTPHMFVGGTVGSTRDRGIALLMAERYPEVSRWGAIVPDTAVGHDSWMLFSTAVREFYRDRAKAEVTLLDPVLTKFGGTDFKSAIGTLSSMGIEGLFSLEYGADGVTFWKQAVQLGFADKPKVICDQGLDITLGKTLGQNTPPNDWALSFWWPEAYTSIPESEELRKQCIAITGDPFPRSTYAFGFTSVAAYRTAILAAGSTETDKIVAALENVKIKSVKGTVYFRKEDHQIVDDVCIINVQPLATAPFWRVADYKTIPGSEVMLPPAPGKPHQL